MFNVKNAQANISISPIGFYLKKDFKVVSLEFGNKTDEARNVHATVFKWERVNGKDEFIETQDLIITPEIFEVKPHSKQVLRVAQEIQYPTDREGAYKIRVREIPENLKQDNKITFAMSFMIPLFIEPDVKTPFESSVKITRKAGKLLIKSNMNYHLKIIGIIDKQKSKTDRQSLLQYIFPDEDFVLSHPSAASKSLSLVFDDNGQERVVDVG